MEFFPTEISGLCEVRLLVNADARGRFKRHFCRREFAAAALMTEIAQVNHSITVGKGSVRGLHFQHSPASEEKLVSCTFGRVFDVAVDLRHGSPTFLRWRALELDETVAFYIPKGCAHGFQTLTEEAHLVYLHSEFYAPEAEGGIRYDDPHVGISWPLPPHNLSERDLSLPGITDTFDGLTP